MRLNEHTSVFTTRVLLVPYSAHHVPKYHEWMKEPDIQEATASEPLTLEEEYDMQRSWRTDPDKLTFIICRPDESTGTMSTRDGCLDPDVMIGDVNLFIAFADASDETAPISERRIVVGELELMIAEQSQQRKGYGKSALLAFLNYILRHERDVLKEFRAAHPYTPNPATETTGFDHFAVKVGASNHRSIALFESLGFRRTSDQPSYFGEYEFKLGRKEVLQLVRADSPMRILWEGYRDMEYSCPP